MLIKKSYWKKDLVDEAFILWMLPHFAHDPEDLRMNQECVRDQYKEYREKGKLIDGSLLMKVVERLYDDKKEFSYNCSDCGFPKFKGQFEDTFEENGECCPLCGD